MHDLVIYYKIQPLNTSSLWLRRKLLSGKNLPGNMISLPSISMKFCLMASEGSFCTNAGETLTV